MNKTYTYTLVGITIVGLIAFVAPTASDAGALNCGVLPQALCEESGTQKDTVEETASWGLLRLIVIILTAGAGIAAIGGYCLRGGSICNRIRRPKSCAACT